MSRLAPAVLEARAAEGTSLRRWREGRGQTQVELAAPVGVSHVVLSRWERGDAPIPAEHRATLAELGWRADAQEAAAAAGGAV